MKIVIDGIDVIVTSGNICIEDSYLIDNKANIHRILLKIKEASKSLDETPFNHRSIKSMANEWITHNNLYKLNYKRTRTQSVDLNYPQKWYVSFCYWIGSRIVL